MALFASLLVCPPFTLAQSRQRVQRYLLQPRHHIKPQSVASRTARRPTDVDCGMWHLDSSTCTRKAQTPPQKNKTKQRKKQHNHPMHFNTSCRVRSVSASTIVFWLKQVCCSLCMINSNTKSSGTCCCFPPWEQCDKKKKKKKKSLSLEFYPWFVWG